MTEKVYEINGVSVHRMIQSPRRTDYSNGSVSRDACHGCVFKDDRDSCINDTTTLWRAEPALLCQDVVYESDDEDAAYDVERDYIFIPATEEGMAAYVAHRLEDS